MAVGDDAIAAGYPLVPNTGEEGRVRYGAREINRTRDFLAMLKNLIPTSKAAYRAAGGFSAGTANASDAVGGSEDGNVYFKIIG